MEKSTVWEALWIETQRWGGLYEQHGEARQVVARERTREEPR